MSTGRPNGRKHWSARSLAQAALFALAALILAWHAWASPPTRAPLGLALALHLAPLLPAVWLALRRDRRAVFIGALGALILFCHGVSEAWSSPQVRGLAWGEIVLSVLVIVGASWDGMRARFAKGRGV